MRNQFEYYGMEVKTWRQLEKTLIKTNPDWVNQFAAATKLSNLSNREALKRIG